jgi:hypothetical protein
LQQATQVCMRRTVEVDEGFLGEFRINDFLK